MAETTFIFKVALQGQKSIWRRIAVKGSQTLDDLHQAVFHAFDRDEEHLYSFYFPRPGTKGRARVRNAVEFSHPCTCEESDPLGGKTPGNAAEMNVAGLNLRKRQTFFYLFDFGDEWWHEITVEQTDAPAEEGRYPRILEKHGKSPPQYPDLEEE